jgi:integrase
VLAIPLAQLLLLTGFRISEGQEMHRDGLHAEEGYVAFPDTKGDAQIRAIGPTAARLAASLPEQEGGPYLFPAAAGNGAFTAAKACLERLYALVGITGVTPYTLRYTFECCRRSRLLGVDDCGVARPCRVHIDEALSSLSSELLTRSPRTGSDCAYCRRRVSRLRDQAVTRAKRSGARFGPPFSPM